MNKYLKYYGIIYIIILVLVVILGITYTGNINYITINKLTPSVYKNDSVRADDLPYVKGSTTGPIDINKVVISTSEIISKGKNLFETNCSGCHGTEGKGDGVAGATLNPKPRNFHSEEGWKNSPKISGIYKTLQEGIPGSGMASYSTLTPEERFSIIHYVRTFLPNAPKDSQDELAELDMTYNLSQGMKQPNQIPVSVAEEKLISENLFREQKMNMILEKINNDKTSPEAIIFREITQDMNKALMTLMGNSKWMESESQFSDYISHYSFVKGFNGKVASLSGDELSALYRYLKTILNS